MSPWAVPCWRAGRRRVCAYSWRKQLSLHWIFCAGSGREMGDALGSHR
jgi:hypothetical protein